MWLGSDFGAISVGQCRERVLVGECWFLARTIFQGLAWLWQGRAIVCASSAMLMLISRAFAKKPPAFNPKPAIRTWQPTKPCLHRKLLELQVQPDQPQTWDDGNEARRLLSERMEELLALGACIELLESRKTPATTIITLTNLIVFIISSIKLPPPVPAASPSS